MRITTTTTFHFKSGKLSADLWTPPTALLILAAALTAWVVYFGQSVWVALGTAFLVWLGLLGIGFTFGVVSALADKLEQRRKPPVRWSPYHPYQGHGQGYGTPPIQ